MRVGLPSNIYTSDKPNSIPLNTAAIDLSVVDQDRRWNGMSPANAGQKANASLARYLPNATLGNYNPPRYF